MIPIPGYRMIEPLGSGGSGTVYRAYHESLRRDVAVKVLAPWNLDDGDLAVRFVREAKLQARLSHPNVLAVFDAGVAGRDLYLVMELVEGGSLRALLKEKGRPELSEALRLAVEVTEALCAAHAAGILHRDLKPENVLLTREGLVKVADFGLAKAVGEYQTVQTQAGVLMGTPGYIAPERFDGAASTPAADVYALGAMFFELFTGLQTFHGASLLEILQQQKEATGTNPRALRPDLPPALDELVAACLRPEPARRPALDEVLRRLKGQRARRGPQEPREGGGEAPAARPSGRRTAAARATGGHPALVPATRLTATSGRAQTARRLLLTAAVAGAVLVAAGVGVVVWRGRPDSSGVALQARAPGPGAEGDRQPAASNGAGPAARLRAVSVSTDRARLWLDGPALPNQRATFWREGSTTRTVVDLRAGAFDAVLSGLTPRTRYRVVLSPPRDVAEREFETLKTGPSRQGALVEKGDAAAQFSLSSHGERVLLAWQASASKKSLSDVAISESLDGGRTWLPSQSLAVAQPVAGLISAAWSGEAAQVAWTAGPVHNLRTWVRTRVRPEEEWSPAVALPEEEPETVIPAREGPASGDHTTAAHASYRSMPHRVRWLCGAKARQALPFKTKEPHAGDSWLLVLGTARSNDREVRAARVIAEEGGPERLYLLSGDATERTTSGTFRPVTELMPDLLDFDLVGLGSLLLLAHGSPEGVVIQRSLDGGRSFSPASKPLPGIASDGHPVLAVCGNTCLMGVYRHVRIPSPAAHFLASVDGLTWTEAGRLDPGLVTPREVGMACAGERVVVVIRDGVLGLLAYSITLPGLPANRGAAPAR